MKSFVSFLSGLIFAIGLGISGMTDPQKVLGFLEISEKWDPSLAFVMVGAICVHALVYLRTKKRASPILDEQFSYPTTQTITSSLVVGSLLFGVGWGMAGLCPGPAVVSSVSLHPKVGIFMVAMLFGFFTVNITRYAFSFRSANKDHFDTSTKAAS